MPKKPLAQKRTKEITAVAARLFSKKGYTATAMSEIVAVSGLSKGAIYHYFPQKDDILFAVLDGYMDVVTEGLEADLLSLSSVEDQIRHIIRRHIDLYVKNIHEAKTLLHDAQNLPNEKHAIIKKKQRHYYHILEKVLMQYSGAACAKPKLTVMSFTMFGMCNWIYSWYDPKKDIKPEELSEIIFKTFTKGAERAFKGQ